MINSFRGQYRFLSNFWPAPSTFEGHVYPTVEHAYQAAKTLDPDIRVLIQSCPKPGDTKKLARSLVLRPKWDELKLEIMEFLVRQKFLDPTLSMMLKDTGDHELIEGNYWGDTYWGVCRSVGENHLGKILMQTRSEIING